jgi:hypothetical protein
VADIAVPARHPIGRVQCRAVEPEVDEFTHLVIERRVLVLAGVDDAVVERPQPVVTARGVSNVGEVLDPGGAPRVSL